ncbi:DUF2680 domain-containing protein [Clostridium autoethanogenum]|uniref:DUF2680 domain-containing protein n=1 Tax=Clostridium autoethanogenum DSM 10061 TaxID=1341692 RepID=A0ABM5NSF4_9CLOT|nr:DUF2680 domain-containing protein [Clostridium autoethanogenum]AGY75180.1 hypothetical protein CAETHG_0955 [Clostridium autoethanogenum DSM 10061]ALU35352.1 hypothetical protein CLAU_0923 [Clostridium autoethanogenum DSM 10061]OVY49569.1 hypothetical protein WX72_03494 [Clostridium autoethanogenum]
MKGKNFLAALAVVLVVGASATVYAETTTNYTNHGLGFGRITSMRGYDYVSSVLKDKLGMTDKEITDGLNSGKTMYDLAKDKGMTIDEFKAALIKEKSKSIDEAVSKGTITKEQGDSLKENIKNNVNNCSRNVGQAHGNGIRGNGKMLGNK